MSAGSLLFFSALVCVVFYSLLLSFVFFRFHAFIFFSVLCSFLCSFIVLFGSPLFCSHTLLYCCLLPSSLPFVLLCSLMFSSVPLCSFLLSFILFSSVSFSSLLFSFVPLLSFIVLSSPLSTLPFGFVLVLSPLFRCSSCYPLFPFVFYNSLLFVAAIS